MAIAGSEPVAELADSTDGTSYALGAFTPSANATLTVLVFATGTTAAGSMSGGGLTWTKKTSVAYNGGADTAYLFWANTGAAPGSTTITFDCTGDGATGCLMFAIQWTGSDVTTADPIKQTITNTGVTPNVSITFGTALGTNNGYGFGFGESTLNPPSGTPPSGWTETADTGYATPTSGGCMAFRATGETGTAYTYSVTAADLPYGAIGFEVYTSGAGPTGNTPRVTPVIEAVGIDQPTHPGSAQYRKAPLPWFAAQQSANRQFAARQEDPPPEAGRCWVTKPPGPAPPFGPPAPVVRARGEDAPMELGRVQRDIPALIPNPAPQKPARATNIGSAEQPAPEAGKVYRSISPPGVPFGVMPGEVFCARGFDAPPEAGRTSFTQRVEFNEPQPGRVRVSRADDPPPEAGKVAFVEASLGVAPPRAYRVTVDGADGVPIEQGRISRSPRSPADPPPITGRPVTRAFGFDAPPEPGSARAYRPVGLTNQLAPRTTAPRGDTVPPEPGRVWLNESANAPLVQQQRPGRAYVFRGEDHPAEVGRAWRARVMLLPDAGQAGHVARYQIPRAENELPQRVYRDKLARVARWPQ